MSDSARQLPPPPYMSFGIFKSTLDTLAESTVPTGPLDRRVLDGLSGADYGALISGLRFLGLVDDERKATQGYRALVHVSKDIEKFKSALLEIITTRYESITGSVDLKQGTISELEKAFKDAGVSAGQMLTKTIRFYVKALQDCGVAISPHITKARRPNGPKKSEIPRRKATPADSSAGEIRRDEAPTMPVGFERLPIPGVLGAFIQYPADLTEANCDLFEAMIGVLRTYVRGRVGGKEKKL